MKFLFDVINKILFGWSAKCGSTHIKNLYHFLSSHENHKELFESMDNDNILDFSTYRIIIFIRNPYERVVSGFLEKYKSKGLLRNLWDNGQPLTFRNFVNELIKGDYNVIEEHHFTPQLSEEWCDSMKQHSPLYVFDITNINYGLLEILYSKKIPNEIREFKGEHCNKNTETVDFPVYDLPIDNYEFYRPLVECFYDEDIRNKIKVFYKDDFAFFLENGFSFTK